MIAKNAPDDQHPPPRFDGLLYAANTLPSCFSKCCLQRQNKFDVAHVGADFIERRKALLAGYLGPTASHDNCPHTESPPEPQEGRIMVELVRREIVGGLMDKPDQLHIVQVFDCSGLRFLEATGRLMLPGHFDSGDTHRSICSGNLHRHASRGWRSCLNICNLKNNDPC